MKGNFASTELFIMGTAKHRFTYSPAFFSWKAGESDMTMKRQILDDVTSATGGCRCGACALVWHVEWIMVIGTRKLATKIVYS